MRTAPPILWSIAGHDTAGGAGLSADQRAADALGVHLCPVVACVTAQHSQGVTAVFPLPADQLDAQLQALAQDLPPLAIKTGLLGSVEAVLTVARWVDRLRETTPVGQDPHQHLALVVDPVLHATAGGSAFSNEAVVQAYRTHLLPRATVLTPNRAEACRLLASLPSAPPPGLSDIPTLADELLARGVRATLITGGDIAVDGPTHLTEADQSHSVDWLQTPHASGWLTAPRVTTSDHHGTGCTLASGVAAALALGHVEADACVLGKMLTHHALMNSHAAGEGSGPVIAQRGFADGAALRGAPLPRLGLGRALPWCMSSNAPLFRPFQAPTDGLYGILATTDQIEAALQAGLRCLQLRHKTRETLNTHLSRSITRCAAAGAQLFINDHWREALAWLAQHPGGGPAAEGFQLGLHLGQEDLLALSEAEQHTLRTAGSQVMLGLSSHSLWELARAAGCGASAIACGPVQPTTTKNMPWLPQGCDNLNWWVRHSPSPVLAIGGLLKPQDLQPAAACGPAALCVVRGLGTSLSEMREALPGFRQAVIEGRSGKAAPAPSLPHPVLARS